MLKKSKKILKPINSIYSSASFFELEQEMIFKKAPVYVGHEKMLPSIGDFFVPKHLSENYIFLRNYDGIQLISNICQHHGTHILEGQGEISSIICPFHRWRYDLSGKLINAPKFDKKPCVKLLQEQLFFWKQLCFSKSNPNIASAQHDALIHNINFENYQYNQTLELNTPYNWKIFIDNYLDDYHVPVIHPGLRVLVNLDDLQWEFDENYSIQVIGLNNVFKLSKSNIFNRWLNEIATLKRNITPQSVMWMLIYPTTMIEVYPYMITISTLKPTSPEHTINHVDFLFDKRALILSPNYPEIAIAAYLETASQDDELCIAIHKGKRASLNMNHNNEDFFHPVLEQGIQYFHDYLSGLIPNDESF